jgi:predicted regulator of Ras-like GTPase activity (Roadblock/LC7/MglB family)
LVLSGADKRLNFFDILDKEGFDAAREFARNDRAEDQRKKMEVKQSEVASSQGLIVDGSISPNPNVDRDVAATVSCRCSL